MTHSLISSMLFKLHICLLFPDFFLWSISSFIYLKQNKQTLLGNIWGSFLEEALFERHFDREGRGPGAPCVHGEDGGMCTRDMEGLQKVSHSLEGAKT